MVEALPAIVALVNQLNSDPGIQERELTQAFLQDLET